jgi:hypothetical protein
MSEPKRKPNRRERRWAIFQAGRKSRGNNRKSTAGRRNQYVTLASGQTRRIQHTTRCCGNVDKHTQPVNF